MKTIKALLAAAVLAFPAAAFAAGAIAVDDEVGERDPGYGYAINHKSRDSAAREAVRECRRSGNDSCKVVARFDRCGAYASSRKYAGAGWDNTKREAARMAMQKCGHERCKVHLAVCND